MEMELKLVRIQGARAQHINHTTI